MGGGEKENEQTEGSGNFVGMVSDGLNLFGALLVGKR